MKYKIKNNVGKTILVCVLLIGVLVVSGCVPVPEERSCYDTCYIARCLGMPEQTSQKIECKSQCFDGCYDDFLNRETITQDVVGDSNE